MRATVYVTSTIIRLLLLSGLAATLSVYLFRELENEQQLISHLLFELPSGESAVSMYHAGPKPGCFGSISYTLTTDSGQTRISARAWLTLSISGKEHIIEGTCDFLFNALGQFGTSLCTTEMKGQEIRLGTTNIDPITLQVFLGRESTTPIVQQNVPGPIMISADGTLYSVTAPIGSSVTLPRFNELQTLIKLPDITTTHQACDRNSRIPLIIPLSTIRSLHDKATTLIPKGLL
jgi:hypothetical protein